MHYIRIQIPPSNDCPVYTKSSTQFGVGYPLVWYLDSTDRATGAWDAVGCGIFTLDGSGPYTYTARLTDAQSNAAMVRPTLAPTARSSSADSPAFGRRRQRTIYRVRRGARVW